MGDVSERMTTYENVQLLQMCPKKYTCMIRNTIHVCWNWMLVFFKDKG